MKTQADLVRGLLRKAESDLTNARLCLAAGEALDTVCFHAQQGAEKCIKAFLAAREVDFPFVHNLEKLITLCRRTEPAFEQIQDLGRDLTPYAVSLRYDDEFWPSEETAQQALTAAESIKSFVTARIPDDLE